MEQVDKEREDMEKTEREKVPEQEGCIRTGKWTGPQDAGPFALTVYKRLRGCSADCSAGVVK